MATADEQWQRAAAAAEVPEGQVVAANVRGRPIALYKFEGEIFATDDECTHECVPLSDGYLDGCVIECPLHAGMFESARARRSASRPPKTWRCMRLRSSDRTCM